MRFALCCDFHLNYAPVNSRVGPGNKTNYLEENVGEGSSGRKNVLRKLLRIPYRRLKAGFSVCLFVAGVLSEMHEVRTFVPCKAFSFDMFAFLSSLENYFGFRKTNRQLKNHDEVHDDDVC